MIPLDYIVEIAIIVILGIVGAIERREHANPLSLTFILVGLSILYIITKLVTYHRVGDITTARYVSLAMLVSLSSLLIYDIGKRRLGDIITFSDELVMFSIAIFFYAPPWPFGSKPPILPPSIIVALLTLYFIKKELGRVAVKVRVGRKRIYVASITPPNYTPKMGLPIGHEGRGIVSTFNAVILAKNKGIIVSKLLEEAKRYNKKIYVIPYIPHTYYMFISLLLALPISIALAYGTNLFLHFLL